jgi:hypothetical protein
MVGVDCSWLKITKDQAKKQLLMSTGPSSSLAACLPALTPAQERNGIFTCAAYPPPSRPAHAPCFARTPLARPLMCVDRTSESVSATLLPSGLLAQLMELTTYCGDCAPDHAPRSARSHLACLLPCVDRTIGERKLIAPRGSSSAANGTNYVL